MSDERPGESGLSSPLSFPGAGRLTSLPPHLLRYTIAPGGCWIAEKRGPNGYAYNTSLRGKKGSQYKLIWEHLNGLVPEGLELDHLCDNGAGGCVNPDHLKAVTHYENMMRSRSFAPVNASKTHCAKGHEYTPENTIYPNKSEKGKVRSTWRACRTCHEENNRRWHQENRERSRELAKLSRERAKLDPERMEKVRARQRRSREKKRLEREAS